MSSMTSQHNHENHFNQLENDHIVSTCVLIPYLRQSSDLTEPKCYYQNQTYFTVFFDKVYGKLLEVNICGRNSQVPLGTHFFLIFF